MLPDGNTGRYENEVIFRQVMVLRVPIKVDWNSDDIMNYLGTIRSVHLSRNNLPYWSCVNAHFHNRNSASLHQNIGPSLHNIGVSPARKLSMQTAFESIVKTQSRIFKTISESTPVEYLQTFIVNVHDTTGLPWWATIITTTILLRTCVTLPLAVHQHYILSRIQNIRIEMNDIVKELKLETAIAMNMYQWDEKTTRFHYNRSLKKQYNALIVRDNCHPFKAGLLILFQVPLWICFSVSLRNLVYMLPNMDTKAQITLIELGVGGFGWIPNLTQVDSFLILPVTLGIVNLAIVELQVLSKPGAPTKFQRYVNNGFRGFGLCMVPLAACVPSCLALYWLTSSTYGLFQNFILLSPKVKRFCRIPKTNSELDKPYSHIFEGIKERIHSIPGISKIT